MATSIKIDDSLKNRIQHLAVLQHRTAHWIMREAIREYVEREESRERFKQDALLSWSAYQETGRHLTAPEVDNWLSKWGTPDETTPPPCHD